MWFPKQRMRFARSVDGKSSEKGFLVLDIKSLDLEGATTLTLDVADVEAALARGDQENDAARRARELLGG